MRRETTAAGALVVESDDGRSGVHRAPDGTTLAWGDADQRSVLLSEVADEPDETLHVFLSDYDGGLSESARRLLAEDGMVRAGRASLAGDDSRAAEEAHQMIYGTQTSEQAQAVRDARARLDPASKERAATHDADLEDARARLDRRQGEPAYAGRAEWAPDGWRGVDEELSTAREAIGGAAAIPTPPPRRDDAGARRASGRGRPLPLHRQGVPLLAPATIATLRGMAASDDPSERARARHVVNAWPAIATVLGTPLMRALRDDAGAAR